MAAKKKVVEEVTVDNAVEIEGIPAQEEVVKDMATLFGCERLNLRKSMTTSSDVLAVLDVDSEIEVVAMREEWTKVKAAGKTGYVMTKYIQKA